MAFQALRFPGKTIFERRRRVHYPNEPNLAPPDVLRMQAPAQGPQVHSVMHLAQVKH